MSDKWIGPVSEPDRYRLIGLKSSGGEGELWQAVLSVDGVDIQVALKIIHPARMIEIAEWRTRWHRQAELLRSLDHPALVKVREVFEGPLAHERNGADPSTSSLYLVMNWVEGPTLDEWVSRNPDRVLVQSARVVGKLATAVDYLHSGLATGSPVLHRDIKPSNVIVSNRGPVLVDFGFTRVLSDQPMTVVGTPYYMAPEVLGNGESSSATDRYSLGATAYFTLTGKKPTPNDRPAMVAALQAVPGAETNPGLADHVLSMMDPDPSRRPMGAIAWAQQLVAGAVSTSDTQRRSAATFVTATTIQGPATPTPVPSPSPVASPAPGRRSRKLLWAAVALLVVAGVAATAVVVMGGNDESTVAPIDTASSNTTASADSTPDSSPETTSPATSTPTVEVVEAKVPSVVGKSLDEALALLSAAGLAGDVKNVEGSGPYQLVSKVSPIAGEKVEPGSSVVLTVPVPPSTMPDVTGSLLTTARRGLESYGIEVTVQEVLQEGTDQQIIDQTPKAGEPYSTAITLTVTRQPAIVYVADLEYVDGEAASRSAQVNGTVYTRSVLIYASSGGSAVEYDLARKYLKLRGIVGPVDQVSASSTYKIEVFADGTRVFDQTLGLGQTAPFDIDVTNVLRLRLQVTLLSGPQRDYVAFADLQILGDPKVVPATTVP